MLPLLVVAMEAEPAGMLPLLVVMEAKPAGMLPLLVVAMEAEPAGMLPLLVVVGPAGTLPLLVTAVGTEKALAALLRLLEVVEPAGTLPLLVLVGTTGAGDPTLDTTCSSDGWAVTSDQKKAEQQRKYCRVVLWSQTMYDAAYHPSQSESESESDRDRDSESSDEGLTSSLGPPVPGIRYNVKMGDVDHLDQFQSYYKVGHTGRKLWKYVFWGMLNIAIINAYIIWTLLRRQLPTSVVFEGFQTT
ncbi:UNVERIFIED_CONTAM: hypothetical protein FKN15_024926 [Acipenser sinensis]